MAAGLHSDQVAGWEWDVEIPFMPLNRGEFSGSSSWWPLLSAWRTHGRDTGAVYVLRGGVSGALALSDADLVLVGGTEGADLLTGALQLSGAASVDVRNGQEKYSLTREPRLAYPCVCFALPPMSPG